MSKKDLISLVCVFALTNLYGQEYPAKGNRSLPEELYAHIVTNGSYVMLADTLNNVGQGEEVDIPSDYYIGKYAVTNKEWANFVIDTQREAPHYWSQGAIPLGRERHPVVWVSYYDALAYCDWLENRYPEYDFRLPTQAEWEYAAVGEKRTAYPWGNQAETIYKNNILESKFNYNAVFGAVVLQRPDEVATYNNKKSSKYREKDTVGEILSIRENGQLTGWINHRDYTGFVYTDVFRKVNDAGGYTCPVDSYPHGISPFGCYNMAGNCWEWTSTIARATNGAEKGRLVNVIKGGSWYATSRSCRVSFRGEGRLSKGRYATVGFRVVAVKKCLVIQNCNSSKR